MRHKPLVISALTAAMAFTAVPAFALPGDPGVRSLDAYRLNGHTLEPGCFQGERGLPQNLSDHIDLSLLDAGTLGEDLHVSVDDDADASVDQVLVADRVGYRVYNTFDTGTSNNDSDIDPGQTGTGMNGFTDSGSTSTSDTIVCVSDHGTGDNEPYEQQAHGMVSAKNRPILTPKVTAIGVSAVSNLHTFKVGFGYTTTKWYVEPTYDGHSAFPSVTDPNAFPSPTWGDNLPSFVDLFPRPADFPYDTRRVNDFDDAREPWTFGDPSDGQTVFFKQAGDNTAWSDPRITNNALFNLLATTTEGDLPLTWTVRPSLAAPSNLRSVTFTDDDFRAWNKSWQDYYAGKGPKPTMPLAPGTNSPTPDESVTVIVNPPVTQPAPTPANPTPAPIVNVVAAPVAAAPAPVAAPTTGASAPNTTKAVTKKAKKKATAKQKKAYAKCQKSANKKKGSKKRAAKAKCARMPH